MQKRTVGSDQLQAIPQYCQPIVQRILQQPDVDEVCDSAVPFAKRGLHAPATTFTTAATYTASVAGFEHMGLCTTLQIDQLTVNRYEAGVGLSPHVDTHFGFTGAITSLSLESPTVMEFWHVDDKRALLLPARSLLILTDAARYKWCVFGFDSCQRSLMPSCSCASLISV